MNDNIKNMDFGDYLLNNKYGRKRDLSKSTLLEVIEAMLETRGGIDSSYGIKFKSLLMHNIIYIEGKFKCTIYPINITDIFWYNFIPCLLSKGLSMSTIRVISSQLKTTLKWAKKHGVRISDTFDIIHIPLSVKSYTILTQDEISHIYHFDINSIDRRRQHKRVLEKVRDMFVLSCNIGQKFTDVKNISEINFDKNILRMVQKNSNNIIEMDMDEMAMDKSTVFKILKKYNYKSPWISTLPRYDNYIKELLCYIGDEFLEEVRVEEKVNGEIKVLMIPKYKLVSSQTARRSFIVNNIMRNIEIPKIMRASGHKTYSTFERYLRESYN